MRTEYVRRRIAHLAGLVLLALGAAPTLAHAQFVQGKLVEEGSGKPVDAATVEVVDPIGRETGRVGRTNSAGTFSIALPGVGRYMLKIRRIGFNPLTSPVFEVKKAGDINVNTYTISQAAIRLATQETISRSSLERGRTVFPRDRALGKGVFLTRQNFDTLAIGIANILRGVEGLTVTADGTIKSTAGWGCVVFMVNMVHVLSDPQAQFRPVNQLAAKPTLEEMLPTADDVEAIEVFRKISEVPAAYKLDAVPNGATFCALIMFWTKPAW